MNDSDSYADTTINLSHSNVNCQANMLGIFLALNNSNHSHRRGHETAEVPWVAHYS